MKVESVVGVWRLVSVEVIPEKGDRIFPFGSSPKGMLVYMDNGYMFGIMSSESRPMVSAATFGGLKESELTSMGRGFNSYAGRYRQDGDSIRHYIDVSFLPNLMRKRQHDVRYEIKGEELLLRSQIPDHSNEAFNSIFICWRKET